MKAIHQIITYLSNHGLLGRDELIELSARGFFPVDEVAPDGEETPVATAVLDGDDPTEQLERSKPRRKRGRGHGRRKAPGLNVAQLCDRLRRHGELWRPALDGLVRIGRPLGGGPTWESAARAVRNAPGALLLHTLAERLDRPDPPLAALWDALELDGYHRVLNEPGLAGPTASIYRRMLQASDHVGLGSYGNLLGLSEVGDVFNLRLAQRALQLALGELLTRRPELVAVLLRRDAHPVAYWAFVLVYNARRGPADRPPWPRSDERQPPRPPPRDADWPRVWGHAAAMDGAAVAPFLFCRERRAERRRPELEQAIRAVIAALSYPDQSLLHDYYLNPLPPGDLARRHGTIVEHVAAVLEIFRQRLRQELAARPALTVFLYPEVARSWEAFLTDAMRSSAAASFDSHYSPTVDLLCPKNWD